MGVGVTELIAVYGAIISTALAIMQIRAAFAAKRFLQVDEEYGTTFYAEKEGDERSFFTFHISNRGSSTVTIRKAAVWAYVPRYFGLRTGETWGISIGDSRCPIRLKPGDTISLEADLKDIGPNSISARAAKETSTLCRVLKLEQSQSSNDFEHKFRIETD
jgi:hypothetical protein